MANYIGALPLAGSSGNAIGAFNYAATGLPSWKRNPNDFWKLRLQTDGYSGVDVQGLIKQALLSLLVLTEPPKRSIDDLWKRYLTAKGYSGDVGTMRKKWLQSKGYNREQLQDLLRALDEDGGTID